MPSENSHSSEERGANSLCPPSLGRAWIPSFVIKPLDIPLNSSLGKPPVLGNNLGYLSFSHCHDALLIGWSQNQLGIDFERSDRAISEDKIVNRLFNEDERKNFQNLNLILA